MGSNKQAKERIQRKRARKREPKIEVVEEDDGDLGVKVCRVIDLPDREFKQWLKSRYGSHLV